MPAVGESDVHRAGDFSECNLASVRATMSGYEAIFHVGVFPATASGLEGTTFSLVHVDADLYSTTRDAIAFFWRRIAPGGVIVFDDYRTADQPANDCPGVARAVNEAFTGEQIELTAFDQCCIRKKPPAAAPPAVTGCGGCGKRRGGLR
jgi:hypothetical protein